jgi:hypothetical protein
LGREAGCSSAFFSVTGGGTGFAVSTGAGAGATDSAGGAAVVSGLGAGAAGLFFGPPQKSNSVAVKSSNNRVLIVNSFLVIQIFPGDASKSSGVLTEG